MLLAGRRQGALPWAEDMRGRPHVKPTLPFQDEIELVLPSVHMPLLLLPRLETVDVQKEPGGLDDIVLAHFVGTKLLIV